MSSRIPSPVVSVAHPTALGAGFATGRAAAGLAAAGAGLLAAGIGYKAGPVAAVVLLVALVLAVVLLAHAEWAVGVAVGVLVVAEAEVGWGIPLLTRFYEQTPVKLEPFQLLCLLAVAAVVLSIARPGVHARPLRPFGVPLALMALALTFGIVHGELSGEAQRFSIISNVQTTAPLFVMPFLIVNVVRTPEQLRRVLGWLVVIVLLKAVLGLVVVFAGLGRVSEGIGRLTYYQPGSNYLLMTFLLAMLAARIGKVSTGRLAAWTVPVALVCLTLSYRRTFWLATVACVLLLLVLGSGRELRRLLPVILVLVAGVGYLVFSGGLLGDAGGEVVARAQSINPADITRSTQDRYRIAERRNVLEALGRQPLTGLGAGVDWPARYPLPFEQENLRSYVHVGFLWWWLKAGLLGGIAYLAVLGSVVFGGLRVWRRHPDPLVRACALAAGVSAVGYLIVELASSVLGPDERGTAMLGCVIGLLAVAARQGRSGAAATDDADTMAP
jgi:O-antigen ligase